MDGNSELKSLKRMAPSFKNTWNFRWKSLQFHRFVRHCYNHRSPMFEEICRFEKYHVRKVP